MSSIIYHYQHLPEYISPTVFSFGFFSLNWYSLMYLFGFGVVYLLLRYRLKKGEISQDLKIKNSNQIFDLLMYSFLGLLIGARLGYIIFYNLSFYLSNPLLIVSPFDSISGELVGIYGMSYHGGFLGVIVAVFIFCKIRKINFISLANVVSPAVPAGYFFGRIGNFLNGELYGKGTEAFWGMYFPLDSLGILRHPSQIYEAIFEGLILFLILWKLRNIAKFKKSLFGLYVLGYAFFRISLEFFREPDGHIGYLWNTLSLGQFLSLFMLLFGLLLVIISQNPKKSV